jgi:hypothetical protein
VEQHPEEAPYLLVADWPEEGGLDRPSLGPRVPFWLRPDVPAEDFDFVPVVVVVLDFGRVVVVLDFGRVVVVVDDEAGADDALLGRVVVVDDDLVVDPRAVVVVVEDLVVDALVVVVVVDDLVTGFDSLVVVVVVDFFAAAGDVVDVVAFGTLGSSLAGFSSRARVGPLVAAPTSGDPGGGGIRSSRRAYCMIRANTGADTCPP